uniref:Uncharacterized protein n=1 Tax=Aegilops tauschii TaxID=37682 RepID=M8CDG4_AEGTA
MAKSESFLRVITVILKKCGRRGGQKGSNANASYSEQAKLAMTSKQLEVTTSPPTNMSSSSMSSDKAKRRVLFAESDKEFVDVLFSFLTLPLGTIVRLFDKQSHVGCLDKEHVEMLSSTPAGEWEDINRRAVLGDSNEDGGFVISDSKFIITDDLQVSLASTRVMFSLMDQFGIPGNGNIEAKVLQLNSAKMTRLLQRAMLTKQPLTGLYFNVAIGPNGTYLCKLHENLLAEQSAEATDPNFKAIKVRLVQTKDKLISANGCMGNLYRSVAGSVKEECQGVLLTPKVAPFFGCSSNVLQMNPRSHDDTSVRGYIKGTPINFMVTNDLQIMPLSLTNTIQLLHASNIPKNKLVEKELTLDKTQVLKIVRAAFETREALSSALLP